MRIVLGALALAGLLPSLALASPAGEQLPDLLYAGEARAQRALLESDCAADHADACFGLGLVDLITSVEDLSRAFYRHGAVSPGLPAAAMFLGIDGGVPAGPANPDPEPLTYEGLRQIFEHFVAGLDRARESFQAAGDAGDFTISLDPLRVRFDIDGDGAVGEGETLAALLADAIALESPDEPPPGRKTKDKSPSPELLIGFDRADAVWFAGYTQVSAAPVDFLLAHDFSEFFAAALHRVFPEAGLPMSEHMRGGMVMMDAESDAFIGDLLAAFHTADFPVTDAERFKGVLARLQAITALSRQNWSLILAETDDNRELVPSPRQTSIFPGQTVTQEVVDAWLAALDSFDRILAGELLIPHWRFKEGFDLKAFFETATETDLVMLFAGYGALPYIKPGPIASADDFAEANAVFGDNWPVFALWFN